MRSGPQVPLQRLWQVAQTHELRQASAALQLQLMDALLRGASDELLKEETLRNAIDEQLGTWEVDRGGYSMV